MESSSPLFLTFSLLFLYFSHLDLFLTLFLINFPFTSFLNSSFIHLSKCLLSMYPVSATLLDAKDTTIKKSGFRKVPFRSDIYLFSSTLSFLLLSSLWLLLFAFPLFFSILLTVPYPQLHPKINTSSHQTVGCTHHGLPSTYVPYT